MTIPFRPLLSAGFLLLASSVCVSCSALWQPAADTRLRMAEPIAFTMQVDGEDRKVPMQIAPGKQEELVAKILQLEEIKDDDEALSFSCIPGYSYSLKCSLRKGNGEPRVHSFTVRRKTWIGNSTVYEFNARDYFTPASWENVAQQLYDADYDGHIDERFGGNSGTPLPGEGD